MSCKKILLIKTKTNASAMVMRRCVLITLSLSVSSTTCKTWPRQLTSCPSQTTAAVHSAWCAGTDLLGRLSPAWKVLFWFSSMLVCTNWKKEYTLDLPKVQWLRTIQFICLHMRPPRLSNQPLYSSVPKNISPVTAARKHPKASSKILTF